MRSPRAVAAFPVLGRAGFIGMQREGSIQVNVGPGSLSLQDGLLALTARAQACGCVHTQAPWGLCLFIIFLSDVLHP